MTDLDGVTIRWNEHANGIGDWCPWSETPATEDELHDEFAACPAGCGASTPEEA